MIKVYNIKFTNQYYNLEINDFIIASSIKEAVSMFLNRRELYLPNNIIKLNTIEKEDYSILEIIYMSGKVKKLMHIKVSVYSVSEGVYIEC